MKRLITPFENQTGKSITWVYAFWIAFFLLYWVYLSFGDVKLFPTPENTLKGFVTLWQEGLMIHIGSTLGLFFKSIGIAIVVSLVFSYLSRLPLFEPLAHFNTKLRYLPLSGLTFYLSMLIHDARSVQIWILVIFTSTWMITSLVAVFDSIDLELDHARSLGCSRWEALLEVVIKSRLDYVVETIRQNLAIVWMMLVTVESVLASAGGIGFLIKNSDKLANHGRIMALQIVILIIGVSLDYGLNAFRKAAFKYTF